MLYYYHWRDHKNPFSCSFIPWVNIRHKNMKSPFLLGFIEKNAEEYQI